MQRKRAPVVNEANVDMSVLRNKLRKTKLCTFFLRDACAFGEECAFAHSQLELVEAPDLRKTRMCKKVARGGCKNPYCMYAHEVSELRSLHDAFKRPGHSSDTRSRITTKEMGPRGPAKDMRGFDNAVDGRLLAGPVRSSGKHPFHHQQASLPLNGPLYLGQQGLHGPQRWCSPGLQQHPQEASRLELDALLPAAAPDWSSDVEGEWLRLQGLIFDLDPYLKMVARRAMEGSYQAPTGSIQCAGSPIPVADNFQQSTSGPSALGMQALQHLAASNSNQTMLPSASRGYMAGAQFGSFPLTAAAPHLAASERAKLQVVKAQLCEKLMTVVEQCDLGPR